MDYILSPSGELYHAGVKGMKWGVRRYQNKDGTLTDAGRKRYARDASEKGFSKKDDSGTYYKTSKKGKREDLEVDTKRYAREDLERAGNVARSGQQLTRDIKDINRTTSKASTKRMDLSKMSDKELRDQINRELLERQYNEVFNPQKVSKGREHLDNVLDVAGSTLGIAASAVGLAVSIKVLLGK